MTVLSTQTLFRHAAWDNPWWVNENRNAGRYNYPGRESTQYLCWHPLGVTAEFLRHLGPEAAGDLEEMRLRLWAMQVDLAGLPEVTFDNAESFGVTAEDLVTDNYAATQKLAQSLRADGHAGLVAPSAALPGTRISVLFGPRLLSSWQRTPLDELQVATAHAMDGFPVIEVVPYVRWFGDSHASLEQWRATGSFDPFDDPLVAR